MSNLGPPRLPPPGTRLARLCLISAEGYAPSVYALHPDTSGDLRSHLAGVLGLMARQVQVTELEPGRLHDLDRLRRLASPDRVRLEQALLELQEAVGARLRSWCSALSECGRGYHGAGCPVEAADARVSRAYLVVQGPQARWTWRLAGDPTTSSHAVVVRTAVAPDSGEDESP